MKKVQKNLALQKKTNYSFYKSSYIEYLLLNQSSFNNYHDNIYYIYLINKKK